MLHRYLYSIFLTAAVLFSNIGLAVNIHYCGETIEKIDLGYASALKCTETATKKACCKEKKETNEKPCCKNETIKQKTDDVVIKVSANHHFTDFITPVVYKFQPQVITQVSLLKKLNAAYSCQTNAPPLYKLYNQYLLYA